MKKDLEIMETFLLEPQGKCRLHAELLTARNNAASRCMLGGWEDTFEEESAASLRLKSFKGKSWDRFRKLYSQETVV